MVILDTEEFEEVLDDLEMYISDLIDKNIINTKEALPYFHAKDKLGELLRSIT